MRAIVFLAPLFFAACAAEAVAPEVAIEQVERGAAAQATTDLSDEAVEDLTFMREEEKLARDVYATLYLEWRVPVHLNIAQSEHQHTQALESILDLHGLPDPVVDASRASIGVFSNAALADLYVDLVDLGSLSMVDALFVGATIEDLDIIDIADAMERTDDPLLLSTYESLMCGSRNHLRSFYDLLAAEGVDYQAQFMSPEQLTDIVGTPYETCGG